MLSLTQLQSILPRLSRRLSRPQNFKRPIDSVIKKVFPTRLIIIVKSLYLPISNTNDSQVRYLFEVLAMMIGEKIIGKFQKSVSKNLNSQSHNIIFLPASDHFASLSRSFAKKIFEWVGGSQSTVEQLPNTCYFRFFESWAPPLT